VYEHLTEEDRERIKNACKEAETWVAEQLDKQGKLPLTADPIVRIADFEQARKKLYNIANPIATKPKPKPAPPAPAPAPAPAPEAASQPEATPAPASEPAGEQEAKPAETKDEPM
jgi:hypothetical protein